MKKLILFLFLVGIFFIGSLTTNALNTTISGNVSFYYSTNNKNEWHYGSRIYLNKVSENEKLFLGDGLVTYLPVNTDNKNNYYVNPNSFYLQFRLTDSTFTCPNDASIFTLTLKAFAYDEELNKVDTNFNAYNFWEDSEFYITDSFHRLESDFDVAHENKCTAISNTNSTITVSCPNLNEQIYYIHFHTKSEPFKEYSSTTDSYATLEYGIFLDTDVYYECLPHPFLKLSSVVDGSSATITVDNPSTDVKGYYFYLPEVDGEEVFSTSSSFVYENLSNGSYTVYVNALYNDGTVGTLTQETFTITNSSLPFVDFTLTQVATTDDGANINVNATNSFSPDNLSLTYYYKLDNGQWYSSSTPQYNFVNVGFGTHYVYVKVEDSDGNFSTVRNKYINIMTNEEQQKPFWDQISDFFTNFWDNLTGFFTGFGDFVQSQFNIWLMNFLDATKRLFVPSEDYLNSWLLRMNDSVNEQMGFLGYPFTWTLDFLQRFVSLEDTGHYIISWGNIKVPNFNQNIISSGSYDLATLLDNPTLKRVHDIYIMGLNAVILLMFLNTCWNKYNEVFGGSTVTYDTEVISDNVITDSDGNIYNNSVKSNRTTKRRRRI